MFTERGTRGLDTFPVVTMKSTLLSPLGFTLAFATSVIAALPSGTVTCGSNRYIASELTAAINAGVKDLSSGNLQGSSEA